MLIDRINQNLLKQCNLDINSPLLIGVSGGADSLALLNLLVEAGWRVSAAHFNHHLRPDADADALFVAEMAKLLEVPFIRGDGEVAAMAAAEKISIETAARKARYHFLFDQAGQIGAQAVVTAHNADDQAETVLLHILRGAGLNGLRGMQPRTILREFSTTLPLVRPLLNIWRVEIDAYCREKGLQPRIDATNTDTSYSRNRIRQELIPILETYNPQVKSRLTGLADNVRNSLEILEPVIREAYAQVFLPAGEGFRDFDRAKMAAMSPAMQVEIIRLAVQDLLPTAEDIDRAALERAATLAAEPKGSQRVDMADGIIAQTSGDRFRITLEGYAITDPAWPVTSDTQTCELAVPGCATLENGWELHAEWADITETGSVFNDDANTAMMDADALEFPLTVRRRANGDVFQPLGLSHGSLALGDFFTNEKIPREARAAWPIVVSGGRIVWVPGCRMADFVKVHENSRRLVRLRLIKTN